MKKYLLIASLFFGAISGHSQQLQTSSFYDVQSVLDNPSMAGMTSKGMIGGIYRTQWNGFSGAPKTATIYGSFELPSLKIGLGGYAYSDKTGPTSRTGLALSFAKHIAVGNGGKFSLGLEARGLQYSIDVAKLQNTLGNDPVLGAGDNKFKFDAGFGISYVGKKLQLGASVNQLVQSKLDFYTGNLSRSEEGRLYRHYFFHGAYKVALDGNSVITPNLMVIYLPNAPLEVQGGVRMDYKELVWWGISARYRQSLMFSAGFNLNKKLGLGYSFDLYQTPVSTFDDRINSHEMTLRYNFSK